MPNRAGMEIQEPHAPDLEVALLRRGVDERTDEFERCTRCHRTPLIGERVYEYRGGKMACALCRPHMRSEPATDRIVHGHTIRVMDQRRT